MPETVEEWRAGPPVPDGLLEVLAESRARHLIGPGDLEAHVGHAAGFARAVPRGADVVDLGSGGGVPGLALAVGRPDLTLTLLDAARRRVRFLEWAVGRLEVGDRVVVVWGRAEELGRRVEYRERHDAVVARSFGPPPVTAECARPLLRRGGVLVVSEPPEAGDGQLGGPTDRWPERGLEAVGFSSGVGFVHGDAGFRVLVADRPCPAELPRRPGVPQRRPRF